MKIVVLGFDGCLPSGMVGLVDMFWLASQAAKRVTPNTAPTALNPVWQPLEVLTASVDGKPLHDGRGRKLSVDVAATDVTECAAILIPGLVPGEDGLPPRTPAMRRLAVWLREQHARGAWVGGSCAGVFVLGEAGLLNGRRCTTTWWLFEELMRRYPKAQGRWGSALLEDERVISVGGPMSWVDLALHVIGQLAGPEAARMAADFAVIDNTPLTQSVYAPRRYISTRDPFLLDAEQAVRQAPPGLTAAALASALATSERTLHRRLKALANESSKSFMTRIRMETARALLEGKATSIKRIAQQSGYEDESSFRRAYTRFAGMSPSTYRTWIKQRQHSATVESPD